jgi:hypothetical protein
MPLLFLAVGLVSLALAAVSFYIGEPLAFVVIGPRLRPFLTGISCGLATSVFIWWLFMETRRR